RRGRRGGYVVDLRLQLGRHLPLTLAPRDLRAPKVVARAEPRLHQLHRRAALRARVGHLHIRHVRLCLVARGLLLGHGQLDPLRLEVLAQLGVDRLCVAALRVPAARKEWPPPRLPHHHRAAALLALDARIRRLDRVALLVAVGDELALRVRALDVLLALLALLQEQELLLALRALVLRGQGGHHRLAVGPAVHRGRALRSALAGEEGAEAAL